MINRLSLAIIICFSTLSSGCVAPQLISSTSDQAITIARDYVQNTTAYGLNFTVIDSVKDIPYTRYSDNKDPATYSNIVRSPSVTISGSESVVILYTWTKKGGMLSKWTITVKDNEPIFTQAESIGVNVGTYGYYDIRDIIPAPGYVFKKESLVPREERKEAKIARDYVSNSSIEDVNFTVINDTSEIPYTGDGFKNPSLYSSMVSPPSVVVSDNESIVTLYAWSSKGGELSRWNITIKNSKAVHAQAYCVDSNVGYTMPINFEMWAPEPGRIFININLENITDGGTIRVARDYVNSYYVHDLNFTAINDTGEIPYEEGDKTNPANYSSVVAPPSVKRLDNESIVTLYSWSKKWGYLGRWDLTIKDGTVVFRRGELLEMLVGHYDLIPDGYIPSLVVFTNESISG